MHRFALLVPAAAAAAAIAVPAAGAATSFSGVVVKRDAARHTIAVASARGVVRTVRTGRVVRLGSRVTVEANRLPDLTFHALRMGIHGRALRARVHGVVLRRAGTRTLVSAGGSVLSIRKSAARALAGSSGIRPGTIVNAQVKIATGGLSSPRLVAAGQAAVFAAEGTISSLSPLQLAIAHGVTLTLAVPAALTLPASLAVGDRVETIVSFDGTGYTLVTLTDDAQAADGNGGAGVGDDQDEQEVEAEGTVTAIAPDASSIAIQPEEDGTAVTFAVPAGFDLSGVSVGSRVEAKGSMQNGVLTLSKLEVKGGDDQGGDASGNGGSGDQGGGSASGGGGGGDDQGDDQGGDGSGSGGGSGGGDDGSGGTED